MKLAPIALFTYNRPLHTRQTVESLLKNDLASQSDLIVYLDGNKSEQDEKSVKEVRQYIHSVVGFKSIQIKEREKNYGLARSIIEGVTETINSSGKIIVLEDDMVVSKYFLSFMNNALSYYKLEEKVGCIHAWNFPLTGILPDTFFLRGGDCWGWATWKRAWDLFEPNGKKLLAEFIENKLEFEFDLDGSYPYIQMLKDQIEGKNNSWAIRWHASLFLQNKLTLYPGKSLLENIGLDNSGTHSIIDPKYFSKIYDTKNLKYPKEIQVTTKVRRKIIKYLKGEDSFLKTLIIKIKKKISNILIK